MSLADQLREIAEGPASRNAANSDDLNVITRAADEIERLLANTKHLREIIQPFAAVADGIPDNWPGNCRLRVTDKDEEGGEHLSYHNSQENHLGTLPTLGQWRILRLVASIRIPE